ncbi:hypothetical protein NQ315_011488 [Exocentrus adspersus]|uniref:THAP-type domain-containing protein n=1 Tax=Exocentrus adspersus TaxID=1586481 RepID=A0AAV8VUI8_9CUCU|nr:hypothetical protein NQ315_011488 [Exocentrus adspersus]
MDLEDLDVETRKVAVEKLLVSVPDYMQKVKCDTQEWTPPFKCAVSSCRNYFVKFSEREKYPYKFHNFPLNQNLCLTWKRQCGLPPNKNISNLKVCSDHFSLDDYIRNYKEEFQNPDFKRRLKPEAIPQRNLEGEPVEWKDIGASVDDSCVLAEVEELDFDQIKKAVDENRQLKNKYNALLTQKSTITTKIKFYEKANADQVKKLAELRTTLPNVDADAKYTMPDKTNVLRKVFSDAQIRLLLGKDRVFWSEDDLAKAFVLRHMGGFKMLSCVVFGCANNSEVSDSSITYYPFPKNELAEEWAAACAWQSTPLDFTAAHVCSIHFEEKDFEESITIVDFVKCYTKKLRMDAVPTLNLPLAQLILKETPLELQMQDMVVYTIDSANVKVEDGITTISLDGIDGNNEKIFELEPSTSEIKVEDSQMQSDIKITRPNYNSIKSYSDLCLLQEDTKTWKKKVEELQLEVNHLQKAFREKRKQYNSYMGQCKYFENKGNKTASQQQQKIVLSKVLSDAQIKILFGKKRINWSYDDLAVAYTIRHLSNRRCYDYITQKLKIPLPGLSSVRRWVSAKRLKQRQNAKIIVEDIAD